jgi:hypothetical protein
MVSGQTRYVEKIGTMWDHNMMLSVPMNSAETEAGIDLPFVHALRQCLMC